MGLDCTYQGIPANSKIISTTYADADSAENIFHSIVLNNYNLDDKHYLHDEEFKPLKDLLKLSPKIKEWNFSPSSRMQDALIYCLNPDAYINSTNFEEHANTFEYGFVLGKQIFEPKIKSGKMELFRFSSPEFVNEYAEFSKKINYETLFKNFSPKTMHDLHVYKISELSEFENIYEYFLGLRKLYIELAAEGGVSLFVLEF